MKTIEGQTVQLNKYRENKRGKKENKYEKMQKIDECKI